MQRFGQLIFFAACLLLCACEGTTFKSSVPVYPVRVKINMDLGEFVHFRNQVQGDYIEVHKDGFSYNGKWIYPLGDNAYGYGGVLVYVSVNGYDAYDLACPYCAGKGTCQTCTIDGIYAVCPNCGEQYDLASGTAMPQKKISKETLKRLSMMSSSNTITVSQ